MCQELVRGQGTDIFLRVNIDLDIVHTIAIIAVVVAKFVTTEERSSLANDNDVEARPQPLQR